MRRTLLAVLLSAACARTPSEWPENQKKQYLSLASGCFAVAHYEVGAHDPDACCANALPSAERNFESYGAWRAALLEANKSVKASRSAPLQNWYADLTHCQDPK